MAVTGWIEVNELHCKGCGLCVSACPQDVMSLDMSRLTPKGYHPVHLHADGVDAVPALGVVKFDVLVTDVCMPEMDGFELARRATEKDPDLKVIFITGFSAMAMQMAEGKILDLEMLSKPFHLNQLTEAVERVLTERETSARR